MLVCVVFEYVERFCGKRDFKRRREQSLSALFYRVVVWAAGGLDSCS